MSARYARRADLAHLYSRLNRDVIARVQERQRVLVALLRSQGINSLEHLDVLEVGCGDGSNLLELVELGATPHRLAGVDLLAERVAQARSRLPGGVQLLTGDASAAAFDAGRFDIVLQSTVFTSILDRDLQDRLAASMWRWLRPGGGVLWYDFVRDNPRNPDVRGVPLARVRQLFPEGNLLVRHLTLAPPLSRQAFRIHPLVHHLLNVIPMLRTHVLCWIRKEHRS